MDYCSPCVNALCLVLLLNHNYQTVKVHLVASQISVIFIKPSDMLECQHIFNTQFGGSNFSPLFIQSVHLALVA